MINNAYRQHPRSRDVKLSMPAVPSCFCADYTTGLALLHVTSRLDASAWDRLQCSLIRTGQDYMDCNNSMFYCSKISMEASLTILQHHHIKLTLLVLR